MAQLVNMLSGEEDEEDREEGDEEVEAIKVSYRNGYLMCLRCAPLLYALVA